jgi:hypothetical protein
MNSAERSRSTNERKTNMQNKKTRTSATVPDLKPSKDAKGGVGRGYGAKSIKPRVGRAV